MTDLNTSNKLKFILNNNECPITYASSLSFEKHENTNMDVILEMDSVHI
jgi:hypothetical protein